VFRDALWREGTWPLSPFTIKLAARKRGSFFNLACRLTRVNGVRCLSLRQNETQEHYNRAEGGVDLEKQKPLTPIGKQRLRP
jgi:hypothetical protein